MAAPTQILPPWLSATEVVVNGQTETSLVFEPLTYFGPSIPLGSLFTFGGSTSPASQASTTATPTSSSSSATSTATPSSTSTSPSSSSTALSSSSTALSSSSSSTASSTSSSTAASTSESPTPSASVTATTQSHGLERGQLIGVIIASILGFIFLFVLALFLYLWWNARRNRRRNGNTRFTMVPPSEDDDLVIVPPGGISPGEGSPRVSGDEADSLIRRQTGGPEMQQASSVAGPSTRQPPPSADNSVSTSSKSSNSAASGYGTLLQNPSLGVFVPQFEDRPRHILSPDELRQFGDVPSQKRSRLSTVGEQGELYPLTPPPRLVDAPRSQSRLSAIERTPSLASQASDAGEVTLLTARRVRAEDLGPRSTQLPPGAESSRRRESGAWKGMGLGGLAALGRLSWFQNITGSSSSRRNSRISASFQGQELSDRDIEAGRALLNAEPGSPPEMSELQGPRFRGQLGLGVGYAGDRPISGTSANSRPSTVYHDAQSSLPGTPLVMPPPRAMANASSAEFGYWPQTGTETASSTTAAQGRSQDERAGTQSTSASTGNPTTIDALDVPIPLAISPFASSQSVREVGTLSSQGSQGKVEFPYPPGLTSFSTPGVWNDTTGTTPSPGSFAAASALAFEGAGIIIDVLEDEPPSPGNSWRTLASGHLGPGGTRRTTFGLPQVVNPPDLYSERGSLHSMHSHLSPVNSRSSGSAPASRRDKSGSSGSASSRPSAHSAARSVVSGSDGSGASLAHSGSISSDDRRKNRSQPPMSPAFSVFGNTSSPPVSSSEHSHYPSSLESPLAEELSKVAIPTPIAEVPAVGSSLEDKQQTSPRSPRSPLSSVPWAGGLDDAWSPS
ncbi:hypothetical protein GGU11DRAFT_780126 [Lentinula aff. detonsa]|uniref:Uncharacterized protein n=1 Tax=Lentinula aff. detonsa TaxID=2804958 RepID=A0AA38KS61_9AGAR|nr:hypothetical protein GGU10DRAFT_306670 [Lentinula aff. detonsa]KAJ3798597.1 hypothetical protein GGU11DRAFT_780126 [Lentinula aff. detonsa]